MNELKILEVRIYFFIKQSKMVRINFKITNQEQTLVMDVDINTVKDILALKEKIGEKTDSSAANIKIIHKGKILKDDSILTTLGWADEETMHVVIKREEKASSSTQNTP